jgi:hypothetical protein
MGKIPTIAIIAIVVVLVIGISVAAFYFLIKPKQEELAGLKEKLAAEQAVVAQKATAEAEKAAVDAAWLNKGHGPRHDERHWQGGQQGDGSDPDRTVAKPFRGQRRVRRDRGHYSGRRQP